MTVRPKARVTGPAKERSTMSSRRMTRESDSVGWMERGMSQTKTSLRPDDRA